MLKLREMVRGAAVKRAAAYADVTGDEKRKLHNIKIKRVLKELDLMRKRTERDERSFSIEEKCVQMLAA